MGLSCISVPILKLDDNICDDLAALKTVLKDVLSRSDYGGRVLPPATRLNNSQFWHFGKCKNPDINFRPDGTFFLVVSKIFRTLDQATAPVCMTCDWWRGRMFM